jgi:hypothetical protein
MDMLQIRSRPLMSQVRDQDRSQHIPHVGPSRYLSKSYRCPERLQEIIQEYSRSGDTLLIPGKVALPELFKGDPAPDETKVLLSVRDLKTAAEA